MRRYIGLLVFLCVLGLGVETGFAKIRVRINNSGVLNAGDAAGFVNVIEDELNSYINDQSMLAKGFANSNAYVSRTAGFSGYHGYDIVGIMFGANLGAQFPVSEIDKLDVIFTQIEDELDTYLGAGFGAAVNIGLNAGHFGLKMFKRDLYFSIKFMYFKVPISIFKVEMVTFGIGVNWQWIKPRVFGNKYLLKWRGVNIGTGLYFNRNAIDAKFKAFGDLHYDGIAQLTTEPLATFGIHTNMATIPIEMNTSIQMLWFLTINAGIGIDLNIGQTDIIVNTKGNVVFEDGTATGASLEVDASTEEIFGRVLDGKLMLGAGINIGPAVLCHVDFTYYIVHGFNLGVSAGFVW